MSATAHPLPDPKPFQPQPLDKVLERLKRQHDEKSRAEDRAVACGRTSKSYVALLQYERRSLIHYLHELAGIYADQAAPPALRDHSEHA